jgi:hypothetical protein
VGKQTLGDPASHIAQANKSECYVLCSRTVIIISFSYVEPYSKGRSMPCPPKSQHWQQGVRDSG